MAIACFCGYLVSRSSKPHVEAALRAAGAITARFGWQVDSSESVSVAQATTAAIRVDYLQMSAAYNAFGGQQYWPIPLKVAVPVPHPLPLMPFPVPHPLPLMPFPASHSLPLMPDQ